MAQIKKKFLASNAVDGQKVQFSNNEAFRAKSSSGVDVELFKLDDSNIFQLLQIPRYSYDPVSDDDLSRKSYVDMQVLNEAAARLQADAAEQAAREQAIADLQTTIGNLSLDSLTDVEMSGQVEGDILRYVSGSWKKESPVDAVVAGGQTQLQHTTVEDYLRIQSTGTFESKYLVISSDGFPNTPGATVDQLSDGALQQDQTGHYVTWNTLSSMTQEAFAPSLLADPTKKVRFAFSNSYDSVALDGFFSISSIVAQGSTAAGPTSDFSLLTRTVPNPDWQPWMGPNNQTIVVSDIYFYSTSPYYNNIWIEDVLEINDGISTTNYQVTGYVETTAEWHVVTINQNLGGLPAGSTIYKPGLSAPSDYRIYIDVPTSQINSYEFVAAPSNGGSIIKSNGSGFLDTSFLQYNINLGGNKLSGVSAPEMGTDAANKEWVEGQVAAEASSREAADSGLQSQIDALSGNSSAGLAQEIADRQAGDANLQSQVDTERGRIDAILLASDADKDSFAEIVQLINSVDTTNDNAFASYVLSNDAALAQEVADRQAGDSTEAAARAAADTALQGAIDQEVSDRQAAVSAEQSAREAAVAALQSSLDDEAMFRANADLSLQGAIGQEATARQAADSAEEAARIAADSDLQDAIDQEIADRQSAVSGEEAARMAADSGIQSELDATQTGAGLGVDGSYTAPVGSQYLGSAVSLKDADSKLDAAIVAEVNARTTAISNVEQSISDLDAAMTQGFDDAQTYTDNKIAALVDGAPQLLDTLNELAAAIGDDENFASNIMTSISNEAATRQAADTAEAQARSAADETLQDNIDAEQAARIAAVSAEQSAREAADAAESAARTAELPRHAKVRMTLTSTDISNGYVDLDHVALGNSVHVFIDRLACHESDDYTLSTVDGVTRVTFSEGFMTSGEAPEAGDLFRCGYAYKNSDQV